MQNTFRKKRPMSNYDFCYGGGINWCDMETGKMYMIQEYREACDRGETPDGIRVVLWGDPEQKTIEVIDPYILKERMKDPEPDPRY